MKMIVKKNSDPNDYRYCMVSVDGGKWRKKEVGGRLLKFIKKTNFVEVSDKPFSGSTEVKATKKKYGGGFYFKTQNSYIWACSEGLRSVGLSMSKLGSIYIKAR